jgi:putative transferase (TIGR04331 family)
MFGQAPRFQNEKKVPKFSLDLNLRKSIDIVSDSDNEFEKCLNHLILQQIPIDFIEAYSQIENNIELYPWPKSPKVIFTSNSHNSDDVFKIWAAKKVEYGAKLIIGQHGGMFGASRIIFQEYHDLLIADKYFNWGWDTDKKNVSKVGMLKSIRKRVDKTSGCRKNLLMVAPKFPRYFHQMLSKPISSKQWGDYFLWQSEFVSHLNKNIYNSAVFRVKRAGKSGESDKSFRQFTLSNPDIRISSTETSKIGPEIESARIYVSTYNATTLIESLSMNIPSIAYWNTEYWELREDAIPYYDVLIDAGILHNSPLSASNKVNEIWDDVDSWWYSNTVQHARKVFCSYFALNKDNHLKNLRQEIKKACN